MSLIQKIEDKLKSLGLVQLEEAEVTESGTTSEVTANMLKPFVYKEVGEPVMSGDEKVEDGIYHLDNGKKITVIKGLLAEVSDIPKEPEATESEGESESTESSSGETETVEMKKDEVTKPDSKSKDSQTKLEKTETESKSENDKDVNLAKTETQRLNDILDLNIPGAFTITGYIGESGEITWGEVSRETYENLVQMAKQEKEQEISTKLDELTKGFETKLADEKKKYESLLNTYKLSDQKDLNKTKPVGNDKKDDNIKLSRVDIIKQQLAEKRAELN